MKKHPDAYGLLQWAVYQGEKTFQVVERDDGHIKTSSIDSMFSGYDEWPESERKAIGYAWGRVLDVGCGPGRHSLYVQGKGLATYVLTSLLWPLRSVRREV